MPSSYAIGEHFERFIRQQVDGGRYASASEVVRDALRLLEEGEQRRAVALKALRDEVRKGVASGRGKSAGEVLDRLRRSTRPRCSRGALSSALSFPVY
jgi:antitoxin ParD1/3/4